MWHYAFASIFWSDRSIRQINTYSKLLHHGWWHKFIAFISRYNKPILTVSINQHWKIMPRSCAMLVIIIQCCPRHQSIFLHNEHRCTICYILMAECESLPWQVCERSVRDSSVSVTQYSAPTRGDFAQTNIQCVGARPIFGTFTHSFLPWWKTGVWF